MLAIIAPEIWRHALDTFGTEERAQRWMQQRLAELGNRTAEQVLREVLGLDAKRIGRLRQAKVV